MFFVKKYKQQKSAGFTLIEILVVIGMTLITATMAIPIYGNLQSSTDLSETTMDVVQSLRKARTLSYSAYQGNSYGVYFDSDNRRFVLYQGESFATRNVNYDMFVPVTSGMVIDKMPPDFEAHFIKGTGLSSQIGSFKISHQSTNNIKTISINNLGVVDAD